MRIIIIISLSIITAITMNSIHEREAREAKDYLPSREDGARSCAVGTLARNDTQIVTQTICIEWVHAQSN